MLRRRFGDVLAVLSGLLVLILLALSVYFYANREILRSLDRSDKIMQIVFMVPTVALGMIMWGWMIADCIGELATRGRKPRLIAWLAIMIMFWPASLVYYLLERRQRQRRPDDL